MILFINTSLSDLVQVKLLANDKILAQAESRERFKQSELLLLMIDRLIKKARKQKNQKIRKPKNKKTKKQESKKADLEMIAVVSGPGSFSSLRLGITTANTLAWALKIPIIELTTKENSSNEKLVEIIKKKSHKAKKQSFRPIAPKYGQEPNITK